MKITTLAISLGMTLLLVVAEASTAEVTEGHADLAAGRIYYQDSGGKGDAVVFLHAASGNSLLFEHQILPVTRAGFRFIAYDRAGQGKSTRTAERNASAPPEIEQLMDHLGIRRFHIVGVAAGGGVALQYVVHNPARVLSIVVANSIGNVQDASYTELGQRIRPPAFNQLPLEMRELGPSYRAVNPAGVQRWLQLSQSGLPRETRDGPQPAPEGRRVGAGRPDAGNSVTFEKLSQLRVPTLLLTGDADLYMPPSVLRIFKQHMPRAELVVVADSGHAAHWENPDAFNRAVLKFLRKH